MKISKIFDYGFRIKNGKNELGLELFIYPSQTTIHSLIGSKFFPPSSSTYKGMNSWDYSSNNPNQKYYNTNNTIFYNLDGDYGVNTLLSALKNIQVTYDEFQERVVFDNDPKKHSGPDRNGEFHGGTYIGETPYYSMVRDNPEYYTEEERSGVVYHWGNDFYDAKSYKDITIVEQYNGEGSKEYYSTPEIIEVLEKWIEVLERWNNPEERQKMIEEYEVNERKRNSGFSRLKKWIRREEE